MPGRQQWNAGRGGRAKAQRSKAVVQAVRDSYRSRERKVSRCMTLLQNLIQWFMNNPLGAATALYITGVISVFVYTYLEPRDQQ